MKNIKKYLLLSVVFSIMCSNLIFAFEFESRKTFNENMMDDEDEIQWYNEHEYPYRIALKNDGEEIYEYEYYNCEDEEDFINKSEKINERLLSEIFRDEEETTVDNSAYRFGSEDVLKRYGFLMDFDGNSINYSADKKESNWIQNDDKWFYKVDNGFATGWKQVDNDWYYFQSSDFSMVTGWHIIDNVKYYFDSMGVWVHDKVEIIDTIPYEFDSNGQVVEQ